MIVVLRSHNNWNGCAATASSRILASTPFRASVMTPKQSLTFREGVVMFKTCNKCGVEKSLEEFHKDRRSKTGLSSRCKACAIACSRANYHANRDSRMEQKKSYYRAHADVAIERARKWAEENPARRREIRNKWVGRNGEAHAKHMEKLREAFKADPIRKRETSRRNMALRRTSATGAGGRILLRKWRAILAAAKGVCQYCGRKPKKLLMEHFVPVQLLGKTEAGNLVPACSSCNTSKGSKPPHDWVLARFGGDALTRVEAFLEASKKL